MVVLYFFIAAPIGCYLYAKGKHLSETQPTLGLLIRIGAGIILSAFVSQFTTVAQLLWRQEVVTRLLRTRGVKAPAKIVEMTDANYTYNDDPVVRLIVEVYPPDGPSFRTELKEIVSRLGSSSHQAGSGVQVLYDPRNPDRLVILDDEHSHSGSNEEPAAQTVVPSDIGSATEERESRSEIEDAIDDVKRDNFRLWSLGKDAEGTILSVRHTGLMDNGNPIVSMTVKVRLRGKPAFQSEGRAIVKAENVSRYRPGAIVWLKSMPDEPKRVLVLEHRPGFEPRP